MFACRLLFPGISLAVLAPLSTAHATEIGGSISLVSDYVFRGVSQTGEDPALQADLNASWSSGFYAGVWASNVDFGPGDDTDLEVDLYAGWAGQAGPVDLDIMAAAYTYPGADGADQEFVEITAGAAYAIDNVTVDVRAWVSPDYYGSSGVSTYVEAGLAYAVTDRVSLDVRGGHSSFEDLPDADYSDYSAGVSYSRDAFTVSARHHWGSDDLESKWVVGLSRTF